MKNLLAPVVLFVYDRPEHTKQTVEGLLRNPENEDSVLFIFADGIKTNALEQQKRNIKKVRDYIKTISGFKSIVIEESTVNKGLAQSVIYGVTKVINEFGKVIVIEDDVVPTPYFLSYVNGCLDKYEEDEHIWCVSGYTDTSILTPRGTDDLFLVNRPSSWGFGTWKRCWDKVIWDIDTLKSLLSNKKKLLGFNKWGGVDSTSIMFALFKGRASSWAIRFNFAAYLNDSKTILPTKSLIENIGQDGTGTHSPISNQTIELMSRKVVIPDEIRFDNQRNQQLVNSFVPDSFLKKFLYHLGLYTRLRKVFYALS